MTHDELTSQLTRELRRLDLPARAIVMPTSWSVGPVIAYLFTDEPVTLIDAGLASSRPVIEEALNAAGLSPADVARILVTHGHGDHLGGALWLQEGSGCDVCLHPTEIAMVTRAPADVIRELFGPLGFAERMLDEYARRPLRRLPQLTPIEDGTVARTGGCRLRVEHHPGHTPGHLWLREEDSGALFAGDYLLASGPTNPGMVTDAAAPSGRAPLLAQYVAGLTELARRAPPVIFAGHGEPITAVRELVQRRVTRIERRSRRVLAALRPADEPTAAELAEELYRGRARELRCDRRARWSPRPARVRGARIGAVGGRWVLALSTHRGRTTCLKP